MNARRIAAGGSTLALAAVFVAKVIGGTVGGEVAHEAVQLAGRATATWEARTVGEVSLETTAPFVAVADPLPPAIRATAMRFLSSMEESKAERGTLTVSVAKLVYREDVEVSIDGAAHGAMQQMAQVEGLAHFQSVTDTVDHFGYPARRSSATFTILGKPARAEVLIVQHGQSLFQIQALGPDDAAPGGTDLRRIVESVRIRPD